MTKHYKQLVQDCIKFKESQHTAQDHLDFGMSMYSIIHNENLLWVEIKEILVDVFGKGECE